MLYLRKPLEVVACSFVGTGNETWSRLRNFKHVFLYLKSTDNQKRHFTKEKEKISKEDLDLFIKKILKGNFNEEDL